MLVINNVLRISLLLNDNIESQLSVRSWPDELHMNTYIRSLLMRIVNECTTVPSSLDKKDGDKHKSAAKKQHAYHKGRDAGSSANCDIAEIGCCSKAGRRKER